MKKGETLRTPDDTYENGDNQSSSDDDDNIK